MYCPACGTPIAPGLSYCNRCGTGLKQPEDSKTDPVGAYLTAITIIGVAGLGIMLGGAIALKNGGQFHEDLIGIFMLMTFVITGIVEFSLLRQLSRLHRAAEKRQSSLPTMPAAMPMELRTPQARALGEPVQSVTENTTRTLEYSRREPLER
jgi:hypothetical protein